MPRSVPASGGVGFGQGCQVCKRLLGGAYHQQQREALRLSSVSIHCPGPGSSPLRGLRFRAVVPAGPFDLEPKYNLQEILIAFYLYNRKLGYDQGSLTCGCQAGLEHKPHLEGETHIGLQI